MNLGRTKSALLFVGLAVGTLLAYGWFIDTPYFASYKFWIEANIVAFILFLFLVKVIGIVWPPLPGGVFTLGAIPLIGWVPAYLIDLLGGTLGGVISYYLGLKYGEKFLLKVFDQSVVDKVKKIKIKQGKEIEAVFVYKVLFGFTIIEAIYYGAGLLKINFRKFFIGAVLSNLAVGIPIFYLVQNVFNKENIVLAVGSLLIAIPIFFKFKSRYFE